MWRRLAKWVLDYRLPLLGLLLAASVWMGYLGSQVKLSYEFARAIPTDNPVYKEYVEFRNRFGDDGNTLVIGVQSDKIFQLNAFHSYQQLQRQLKQVSDVQEILGLPGAIRIVQDDSTGKLAVGRIFADSITTQADLDSAHAVFTGLSFYKYRLYNPSTNALLMAVRINKDSLNSAKRTQIVGAIQAATDSFSKVTGIETHLSGLPLIRTLVANKIQVEMRYFLIGSLVLSALILLLFFRSVSVMLLSLLVVILGVVWSLGLMKLCGYNITLLTALTPPLVVVIGIPNCIYFINKYHSSFVERTGGHFSDNMPMIKILEAKHNSLLDMVSKMGVVTLFCNITAAIGFAVFALTKSLVLREFGVIAGVSIMFIFVISFILLPGVLSYLPAPGRTQTRYLTNRILTNFLVRIETWVLHHRRLVYLVTGIVLLAAGSGLFRLKTEAFIVDDLPHNDKIYADLKFFEKHFTGVMPLELVLDTKKAKGILKPSVDIRKIAEFQDSVLRKLANVAIATSVVDPMKFTYQAVSGGLGDSTYLLPSFGNPMAELHKTIREMQQRKTNGLYSAKDSAMEKLVQSFVDSSERYLRISMSIADVGTRGLHPILDTISHAADSLLNGVTTTSKADTAAQPYKITITGTSSTFLEGSRFIINGLKESIAYAFILIAFCMLYLFRSMRILICSLIPNMIPLVITAGVMGWAGVPLKPSTVLVFSVALGIAIDITIRFLVNYKQELPVYQHNVIATVAATIKHTGLSIVYTSLVLVAGFVIFCFSHFGGTFALGWLTSLTLLVSTLTNLILLPVLLLGTGKKAAVS